MKARAKKRHRPGSRNGRIARDLLLPNVYTAIKDESYTIIARLVDDTLKDPVVRAKIEEYSRRIIKLIAKNI